MKTTIMTACLILSTVLTSDAQTYRWTDAQGVMHFTDSPESIPAGSRGRVVTGDDITIRDSKVREEIRQHEERTRLEEASRPRIVITPDYVPVPEPEEIVPAKPASDELPPGRTKSQRIRDNIERRQAEEERARQSGQLRE